MLNKNEKFERNISHSHGSLSFEEQSEVLRNFPSTIKFSYERRTHKKVLSDLYVIIPKGKKYFVWITQRNRKNICFFLEIGYQNKIMNIFYRYAAFDDILSYGTVFYGTLFRTNSDRTESSDNSYNSSKSIHKGDIFSVEDIFYYKGNDISNYSYEDKLNTIKNIFETKLRYNTSFTSNGVVFGIPYITTNFIQACSIAEKLPYSVYSIQYRYLKEKNSNQSSSVIEIYHFASNTNANTNTNTNTFTNCNNNDHNSSNDMYNNTSHTSHMSFSAKDYTTKNTTDTGNTTTITYVKQKSFSNDIYKVFYVKPDLQNDIYYLYHLNSTNFEGISKEIAHIPDYKTSVFMNKLFRNIKENKNLDSLEESDDEEEFENIQIDKFVDLNKITKMRCIFNHKFKKWVPISVT